MKIVLKFQVPIPIYFLRNKPSKSVTVEPVHRFKRFTQSENCHKTLFQVFLKVLELSECRRGDPYMTANRNFVRFALCVACNVSVTVFFRLAYNLQKFRFVLKRKKSSMYGNISINTAKKNQVIPSIATKKIEICETFC